MGFDHARQTVQARAAGDGGFEAGACFGGTFDDATHEQHLRAQCQRELAGVRRTFAAQYINGLARLERIGRCRLPCRHHAALRERAGEVWLGTRKLDAVINFDLARVIPLPLTDAS